MFCQIQGQAFFHRKIKAKSTKKPPTIEKILFPQPPEQIHRKEEDSGPLTPHFKFRYKKDKNEIFNDFLANQKKTLPANQRILVLIVSKNRDLC